MTWRKYIKRTPTEMALVRDEYELDALARMRGLNLPQQTIPSSWEKAEKEMKPSVQLVPWPGGVYVRTQTSWSFAEYPFWLALDAHKVPYPISLKEQATIYNLMV